MDYNQCVGHTTRGKNKGMRCTKEGTIRFGVGDFKVCEKHSAFLFYYTGRQYALNDYAMPPWLKDIITRALKGRYDGP